MMSGTDTTEYEDDLPKMMASSIEQCKGKIKDDHDVDYDFSCTSQQCDDIFETINRALLNVAAIAHATTMPMATKRNSNVRRFSSSPVFRS